MIKIIIKLVAITCLWTGEIYSQMSINGSDIWVMPETFVDDGKPYMEFDCGAFLHKGDMLTWYKAGGGEYFTSIEQKHEDGYRIIKLLWPLQLARNNSKIRCVKKFKKSSGMKTKAVFISYQPLVEVLKDTWGPWVWPNTKIIDNSANIVELSCWAYLYKTGMLTWYQKQANNTAKTLASIQQETIWGYVKIDLRKYIQPFDDGGEIYCKTNDHQRGSRKSSKIKLVYNQEEIDFESSPQLTPKNFTDDGNSLLDFTCRAYLGATDLLSWFHVKDANTTERLETIQQDNRPGHKEIKLLKALVSSDNGTHVYCAKENVSSNGELFEVLKSVIIPIVFQKEKPFITVEPKRDIIIFKEDDAVTLVCGGSVPVNNRSYTWYIQGPHVNQINLHQHINTSTNQNRLELNLTESFHESQLYCAQDYRLELKLSGDRHKIVGYGEMVRSNMIKLFYEKGSAGYPENPQVIPNIFVDDHKPYMEFTCLAYARPGEVLAWYQSKGPYESEDTLLRMVQPEKSEQWMDLILNKTLEQTDNNRDVYCAKQKVFLDGKFSKGWKSQPIEIKFQQYIMPLETLISIEPKTDVFFEVNASLNFNCSGSAPVDGRIYAWFRIDAESKVTIPDEQIQVSPNLSILELSFDESHHQNQLFCAQMFLTKIQIGDEVLLMHYGELVTSNKISLFLQGKEIVEENDLQLMTILGIAVPLTVVVAVVVAVLVVRWRRSPPAPPATPAPYKEENLYANVCRDMDTTEVTYAELQFSASRPRNARSLRIDQACEYATIVPRSQR